MLEFCKVKRALSSQLEIKDLGELHYFLGMKIVLNEKIGEVWIGQPAYAEIQKLIGMENCKPVGTPVDTSTKLVKSKEGQECVDQGMYQSAVGSLLYLSGGTRPDIAYAVSNVAKFCEEHWTAVKRIMRYLQGTLKYGLLYNKDSSSECVGYADADWAGDLDDCKSTSGYLFQISVAAVSWRSKKQPCVALSTAEAEYVALASAAQEAIWMRQLTTELSTTPTGAITMSTSYMHG